MTRQNNERGAFLPPEAPNSREAEKTEKPSQSGILDPSLGIDPEPEHFVRGDKGFPYLVVRIMAAVYQREAIAVHSGPAEGQVKHRGSFLSHPGVSEDGRTINNAARTYFETVVLEVVQRTGYRMCIVWAKDDCSFVERDGSIDRNLEAPSGGIWLRADLRSAGENYPNGGTE